MAVVFLGPLIIRVVAWLASGLAARRLDHDARAVQPEDVVAPLRLGDDAARADGRAVGDDAVPDDDARARHLAPGPRTRDRGLRPAAPTAPASRDAAADQARRIAGVDVAVAVATTTLGPSLGSTYQAIPAAVVDPRGAGQVLDLDVREGSLAGPARRQRRPERAACERVARPARAARADRARRRRAPQRARRGDLPARARLRRRRACRRRPRPATARARSSMPC